VALMNKYSNIVIEFERIGKSLADTLSHTSNMILCDLAVTEALQSLIQLTNEITSFNYGLEMLDEEVN